MAIIAQGEKTITDLNDGVDGIDGNDGVSVEELIIEYSSSGSTTLAPSTGWGTLMPNYIEGYFLWIRTRTKYTNSDSYVYSTPVCDQSWKTNTEVYSQYKQLSDKFMWLIKSGTSESTMVLTDKLYSLITDYVLIKAKLIELQGKVNISGSVGKVLIDDGNISLNNVGSTYVGGISGDGITYAKVLNPTTNPMFSMLISNGSFSLKNFSTLSLNGTTIDSSGNVITSGSTKTDNLAVLKTGTTATYYNMGNFSGDAVNSTTQGIAYLGNTILIYGSYKFTSVVANTAMTTDITFKNAFALQPFVTTTTVTSVPEKCFCGVTSVTATGFTINFYRTTSVDTTIYWQAMGQRA